MTVALNGFSLSVVYVLSANALQQRVCDLRQLGVQSMLPGLLLGP